MAPTKTAIVYQKLGIGLATSVWGIISLVLMPVPCIFYKYGPAIRARSKYRTT